MPYLVANMNTILILGAGIAVPIFFISFIQFRSRKKSQVHKSDFMNALFWLIEGKDEQALEALKKTVKKDTDNIMAYIQLGMLMRRMNQPAKAAKIHKNLLLRADLTSRETMLILRHLMIDYQKAGLIDLARQGIFKTGETVLFWHTGGTPALFAEQYASELV